MNKTFSIDLTSLYEYIGDGHTEYGYYIDHEEDSVNEYFDLRDSFNNALYACDGEECEILYYAYYEWGNYMEIRNVEHPEFGTFKLSADEFDVCCHTES